jgi:hypothetical protein
MKIRERSATLASGSTLAWAKLSSSLLPALRATYLYAYFYFFFYSYPRSFAVRPGEASA